MCHEYSYLPLKHEQIGSKELGHLPQRKQQQSLCHTFNYMLILVCEKGNWQGVIVAPVNKF